MDFAESAVTAIKSRYYSLLYPFWSDSENLLAITPKAEVVTAGSTPQAIPAIITTAGKKAIFSFANYFTAEIENPNTCAAYLQAWREFNKWTDGRNVRLDELNPLMIAGYHEDLGKRYHVRNVKQHLAALRKVFDQLVVDQVIPLNPAATVRGSKFSAQQGVTPILSDEETRKLFNSLDTSHTVGLRDRAILSVLVFAVARVGAVVGMQVRDFYPQGRKWKV